MLRSKAGVVNKDYLAQKSLLAKLDQGELQLADVQSKTRELFEGDLAALKQRHGIEPGLQNLLPKGTELARSRRRHGVPPAW